MPPDTAIWDRVTLDREIPRAFKQYLNFGQHLTASLKNKNTWTCSVEDHLKCKKKHLV
jgi:hypothetical protein